MHDFYHSFHILTTRSSSLSSNRYRSIHWTRATRNGPSRPFLWLFHCYFIPLHIKTIKRNLSYICYTFQNGFARFVCLTTCVSMTKLNSNSPFIFHYERVQLIEPFLYDRELISKLIVSSTRQNILFCSYLLQSTTTMIYFPSQSYQKRL